MSTTVTEYITNPGDRWDLIAYKAYGTIGIVIVNGVSISAMSVLANANPDVAINDIILPGILLQIPVIPSANVTPDNSVLPPWKKS